MLRKKRRFDSNDRHQSGGTGFPPIFSEEEEADLAHSAAAAAPSEDSEEAVSEEEEPVVAGNSIHTHLPGNSKMDQEIPFLKSLQHKEEKAYRFLYLNYYVPLVLFARKYVTDEENRKRPGTGLLHIHAPTRSNLQKPRCP